MGQRTPPLTRRAIVEGWLRAAIAAVDPEKLTRDALAGDKGAMTVIAIGKAAPAMCRGAEQAVGPIEGLCVTNHQAPVPDGVELMIGDHPIPGRASLAAGEAALVAAAGADLALVSGGGSALCEKPLPGVDFDYLATVNRRLIDGGAAIEEANLVRGHLSAIKCGGLGAIPTLVLSDVSGADPGVVSSGPTVPMPHQPERALELLGKLGMPVPDSVASAIATARKTEPGGSIRVIGDGRTAAEAAKVVATEMDRAQVRTGWLSGPLEESVAEMIDSSEPGVTFAAGETTLAVQPGHRGGRNTHAALLAATLISGTDAVFAALATDGVDGRSGSAGAIVDSTTMARGGDPSRALGDFESGAYLETTGDLIHLGPTGTNVADLWMIWKPARE